MEGGNVIEYGDGPPQQLRAFLFEYEYGGDRWPIQVMALTVEEARDRLNRILFAELVQEDGLAFLLPAVLPRFVALSIARVVLLFGMLDRWRHRRG